MVTDLQIQVKREMINGRIYKMPPIYDPEHGRAIHGLYRIFSNYCFEKGYEIFSNDTYAILSEDNKPAPDFMIICDTTKITAKGIFGAPDLIVEVLSAGTRKYDRTTKKEIYEKYGVKEYWLIDPRSRTIDVFHLINGKYVMDNTYEFYAKDELIENLERDFEPVTEFKTSLFDDLTISINDIFWGM